MWDAGGHLCRLDLDLLLAAVFRPLPLAEIEGKGLSMKVLKCSSPACLPPLLLPPGLESASSPGSLSGK